MSDTRWCLSLLRLDECQTRPGFSFLLCTRTRTRWREEKEEDPDAQQPMLVTPLRESGCGESEGRTDCRLLLLSYAACVAQDGRHGKDRGCGERPPVSRRVLSAENRAVWYELESAAECMTFGSRRTIREEGFPVVSRSVGRSSVIHFDKFDTDWSKA